MSAAKTLWPVYHTFMWTLIQGINHTRSQPPKYIHWKETWKESSLTCFHHNKWQITNQLVLHVRPLNNDFHNSVFSLETRYLCCWRLQWYISNIPPPDPPDAPWRYLHTLANNSPWSVTGLSRIDQILSLKSSSSNGLETIETAVT